MSITTLVILIPVFAILVFVSDYLIFRKINYSNMMIMDKIKESQQIEIIGEPEIEEEYKQDDEGEEDEDESADFREELNVEINREVEKITEEMRHHEQMREKLEKHYVTLRKVARDMLESLVMPEPFVSISESHVAIPVMDERPLWIDLAKNHIPPSRGEMYSKWSSYIEKMNRITEMKVKVLRAAENYLFAGLGYERVNGQDSEPGDKYYSVEGSFEILNSIFYGRPLLMDTIDGRKQKKSSKYLSLIANGKKFAEGRSEEILAIKSKVESLINAKDFEIAEMKEMRELISGVKEIKGEMEATLNWFIFDNAEMKMCEMVRND